MRLLYRSTLLVILVALLLPVSTIVTDIAAPPVAAQSETPEERKARKRAEKEARIQEYLRKKEERRARRETNREQKAAVAQAEAAAVDSGQTEEVRVKRPKSSSSLPRNLERAQQNVRGSQLGQDPTVQGYLELIDGQNASPHQLAAFGNFLSQNGMTRDAIEYYDIALDLEPDDAVLWVNYGTLRRQLGEISDAASAYSRALSIDRNYAFAHYNLGAALDAMGQYESSIEEYKIALTLDPSLGDPTQNPQAANNERLLAVKLLLYREQSGSLGLPLVDVPGGTLREASQGSTGEN